MNHPAAKLLWRGIDELDLVGFAHDPVRHPFAYLRASDVLDLVGDAFEMLDVDGGDDVDAGVEFFQDILPALFVPAGSRHVRVGKLVDERDRGMPSQYRVKVHLIESASPVLDHLARYHLKAVD